MRARRADSLQASAHNIANLATPGFRRERVVLMELDGSGVAADWTRAPALGAAPDEDLVGLRQAKNAFLANLAGFRCSEHMLGAPLDATD